VLINVLNVVVNQQSTEAQFKVLWVSQPSCLLSHNLLLLPSRLCHKSEAVPFTAVLILETRTITPAHRAIANWLDITVVKQNWCVCVEEKWNNKTKHMLRTSTG